MINTNLTAVTTGMINSARGAQEAEAVATAGETAGILGGDNMNVTAASVGAAALPTIQAPVLAEAEDNSGIITDKIIANIEQAAEDVKALQEKVQAEKSSSTASTGSSDTTLVDIYQVMTLLLQIARKQREVARTARAADLQNTVAQIKAQAADQRSAAVLSLGLSVALSAASLGFQMGSYFGQRTARANIQSAQKNSGLTQATQMSKITNNAVSTAAADRQVMNLGRGLSREQIAQVDQKFGGFEALRQDITTRSQELNVTRRELTQTEGQLATLKAEYSQKSVTQKYNLDGKQANKNVEAPDLDIAKHSKNLNLAEKNSAAPAKNNELETLKTRITALEGKVDQLKGKIERSESQITYAKNSLAPLLDEHLASITGDGKHELTPAEQYAVAKNMALRQKLGLGDSVKELGNSSTQKQVVLKGELELSADYLTAIGKQDKYQTMSSIVGTLSQMLGGVSQSTATAVGAAATEREADAKTEEYQKQESDELASSAQELLNQVVQMLQQVNQIQNQSIESAIKA